MASPHNESQFSLLNYKLPDGEVYVPTWDYIIEQITPMMVGITADINTQNEYLTRIRDRIDEWIDAQPTENESVGE